MKQLKEELEQIIFWSIICSLYDRDISVSRDNSDEGRYERKWRKSEMQGSRKITQKKFKLGTDELLNNNDILLLSESSKGWLF